MLSHYSSFKVAENFRLLEALYPGRIDLGIGRAPGSDQLTAAALAYPGSPRDISHFPRQITDLLGHLSGGLEEGHPFSTIKAGPSSNPPSIPQVWLLGSRTESAHMAAQLGLPFAYAHFFRSGAEQGPAIVDAYRKNFKPSEHLSEPLANVGVHVVCAETEEEAFKVASSRNLGRLYSITGRAKGIPSIEEAQNYPYQSNELAYVDQYRKICVDGDPAQCRERLEEISEWYQTPDLSIVTICHLYQDRLKSYQLLSEEFGLLEE